MDNKRKFTRTAYHSRATLGNDDTLWEIELEDISLNGLLIKRPANWEGHLGDEFSFDLPLGDGTDLVVMRCKVAREDDERVGLQCTDIGIESVTHLRRMMELNTGDPELVNREFSQLWLI